MSAAIVGAVLALLLAAVAYLCTGSRGGFYDAEVYGMTARTHRAYALASLVFAAAFLAVSRWFSHGPATIWLFAAFVLVAVFYLSSYLHGAHEDDE